MLAIDQINFKLNGKTLAETPRLNLTSGQFISVLGPNGAGKSSLVKLITQEWKPQTGQILFQGKDVAAWNKTQLARNLGVLPQANRVEFPFTAFEVASIGTTPLSISKKEIPDLVKINMLKTDTWHLKDQTFSSLSGGEKQRVQLARVLIQLSQANAQPLLLLDEPTSAQDLGHQHHILKLVRDLCINADFGVLAVLHDLNLAGRYSDYCWVINQGKTVMTGKPEDILTPTLIEQYWHYRPQRIEHDQHSFALL